MTLTEQQQGLILAGGVLAVSAGLRLAADLHIVSTDWATRLVQAAIGLALAVYANRMPKQISRRAWTTHRAQTALRLGGWSCTIAGLVYAALSLLAPRSGYAAMAVVGVATGITVGAAIWACGADRRELGGGI